MYGILSYTWGCLWIRQGSLELEKHVSVVAVKTLG